jgi:hypothetical protein
MPEPSGSSLGRFLGWLAVAVGIVYLGFGFGALWKGQQMEAIDGLIFGGLAFLAGCVILYRRGRMARSKENRPGPGESGAAAEKPDD